MIESGIVGVASTSVFSEGTVDNTHVVQVPFWVLDIDGDARTDKLKWIDA